MGWHRAVTDDRVWDQQLDTPRFRKAFTNLIKNCRQWPSPAAFMEAMPPREQLALTKQPIKANPERAAQAAAELASFLGRAH